MKKRLTLILVSLAFSWNSSAHSFGGSLFEECFFVLVPQSSIAACTEIIENGELAGSELAKIYSVRGMAYADDGQAELALADIDEALRIAPDDGAIHNDSGIVFSTLGYRRLAIVSYDEAIRLNPEDRTAFHNRGLAFYNDGDLERSIEDFDAAIGIRPDPLFFHAKGRAHSAMGQSDLALAAFQAALAEGGDRWVRRYQEDLSAAGFYEGAVDGVVGEALTEALAQCVAQSCDALSD